MLNATTNKKWHDRKKITETEKEKERRLKMTIKITAQRTDIK